MFGGVEKIRALGASGEAKGSIGAEIVGGIDNARVVSMGAMGVMRELSFEVRSIMILESFLGGLSVEEEALVAMDFLRG